MGDDDTLEEPNGKETGRREDRDLGERPGGEIQEFYFPQRPPQEAQAGSQRRDEGVRIRRPPYQARGEGNGNAGEPEARIDGQPG